jgi:isocitrate dehydrogenase
MFDKISHPSVGEKVRMIDGKLVVPDNPIIPYIAGDGIGPDIMNATIPTINAAVEKAYSGKRKISWFKIYAGDEARDFYHPGLSDDELLKMTIEEQRNAYLPQDTLKAIQEYLINIKGPLTTPIGGGFRSLNVGIRQKLDLYACVRPVRYFDGVPTRTKYPEEVDMVIFRENSEDVYSGIEFRNDEPGQKIVYELLKFMYSNSWVKTYEKTQESESNPSLKQVPSGLFEQQSGMPLIRNYQVSLLYIKGIS